APLRPPPHPTLFPYTTLFRSYRDAERKAPFAVIECKRDGITEAEFAQAIEQACGNRASLAAIYSGVVAGITTRFLDFDPARFPRSEEHTSELQSRSDLVCRLL